VRYFLLVLIAFVLLLPVKAQDRTEFGKVNVADFNTDFGKDYSAAVLYDQGKSTFTQGNNTIIIRFERETRMIIRKKPGFQYAEIVIPFYSDGFGRTEQIEDIVAITHNIDSLSGHLTKAELLTENIYEEDVNKFWKIKKFVFPDVREGSIVEFRYVKRTPFLFNPPDWEFQQSIPVKESSYEIWLTPFYDYTYLLQGASKFDGHTSFKSRVTETFAGINYNFMIHRYVMRNLPAFEDESFITSRDDYIVKLDFQLSRINYPTGGSKEIMTSWPLINDDFLKSDNFGKYLKQAEKEAGDFLEETGWTATTDPVETLSSLVWLVRNDFEWNGSSDKYATERAKDVVKSKKGNSAEINLFLCAVLREAGYKASPVLLSTRGHGKVHAKYPFSHYFNDVVCFVEFDDKSTLVDATESLLPYNRLPLRCLNESGLIVEERGQRWVSLETSAQALVHHFIEIEPQVEQEEAKVIAAHRLTGYSGYAARKSIYTDSERLSKSRLAGDVISLEDVSFENAGEPNQPYQVRYTGMVPIEVFDDKMMIYPFIDLVENETPLKSTNRQYPVDMIYRQSKQMVSKVHIPDGYRVLDRPDDLNIDDALVRISLQFTERPDALEVQGVVEFKKSIYEAKDYQKLRTHYLQIVTAFNEPVILQEISDDQRPTGEE